MGRRNCVGLSFLAITIFCGASSSKADGLKRIIEASFRNAIVKVDVSSQTPIIKDGKNLCLSEGTGFLLSSRYVASAGHVFDVDRGCGELTIVLKSRRNNIARVAKLVASADDVALLAVDDPFASPMCSITLMDDVFNSDGFRIGIPGGLQDPVPKEVVIGMDGEEWKPLVLLTPTPAEEGESGGPILVDFNVVGILKAKHKQYTGYSFMTKASLLRKIMLEQRIALDGSICNPVNIRMIGNAANVRADHSLSAEDQDLVLSAIQKAATAKSAGAQDKVKVVSEGSSISISGVPHVVIRQQCTNILGGFRYCVPKPEIQDDPVAASAAANQLAYEIKNQAATTLWRDLKN
ncbi:S1 family peptidase [Bradyrhizobium sp. HKCCYLS2038]|uniref:S1 family peptidase n=1 Tax=unclassified Bradyrhizobium TaxID=2631580 RepID=UPI003EBE4389